MKTLTEGICWWSRQNTVVKAREKSSSLQVALAHQNRETHFSRANRPAPRTLQYLQQMNRQPKKGGKEEQKIIITWETRYIFKMVFSNFFANWRIWDQCWWEINFYCSSYIVAITANESWLKYLNLNQIHKLNREQIRLITEPVEAVLWARADA